MLIKLFALTKIITMLKLDFDIKKRIFKSKNIVFISIALVVWLKYIFTFPTHNLLKNVNI